MNDAPHTGGDLIRWMDAHGHTPQSLADAIGVTRETIYAWRNGKELRKVNRMALWALVNGGENA